MEGRAHARDVPVTPGLPDALPREVLAGFEGLETPDPRDLAVCEKQIGRPPRGAVFVACRCPHGLPAVILTVVEEPRGGPLPPLLWLTCPRAVRECGRMEGSGFAGRVEARLRDDGRARAKFLAEERRYSALQVEIARRKGRPRSGDSPLIGAMGSRGVAGGPPGAVKCLHAHLAYRLAGGEGVIGGWCLKALGEKDGIWCERPPQACVC